MTKKEFIRSWIGGRPNDAHNWTMFMTADLDSLIASAIADHEQAQWTIGNIPEIEGDYMVQFEDENIDLDHWNGKHWDMVGQYAIAFRPLPEPYKTKS